MPLENTGEARSDRLVIIYGIDPGSRILGYGWIELAGPGSEKILGRGCGVIRTRSDLLPGSGGAAARLSTIMKELEAVFTARPPSVVVVEKVFLGKSVESAFVLGQARGVVLALAAQAGAQVREEATKTVKKTVTGNGAAQKADVQFMLGRLLDFSNELSALPLDASDALALAYQGWRRHLTEVRLHGRLLEA